ncbi:hypothetical protein [Pandoraea sp. NPDC087047]|uniref:hypothetical protein n=1 Tax=Pandoraea sp. NPDC087047 TaxID=3364390 RepID=UPI0038093E90
MQPNFRAPPYGTELTDAAARSSQSPGMSQRRLNDFLDAFGRRNGLSGLQARTSPGAGVTLENGDAIYFRANDSVDTFDVYFRIDVPPAMLSRPELINLIIKNCISGDICPPTLFISEPEGFLLFGLTDIEYGDTPENSENRINACFSEYRNLVKFLRNEVN